MNYGNTIIMLNGLKRNAERNLSNKGPSQENALNIGSTAWTPNFDSS